MDKKLNKEDMTRLFEIYLRKGHVNPMDFGDSPDKPEAAMDFAVRMGFHDLYETYGRHKVTAETTLSDTQKMQAEHRMNETATLIREYCRAKMARDGGLDIEKEYGRQPDRDTAKEMIRRQLVAMGIPEQVIDKMQLDNIDEMLVNDKDFTVIVDDTPENRQFFDRQEYEYEVKDGKLHAQATVHVEEGIAIEDTPETTRLLDENEIDYVKMAMGKNPKGSPAYNFIPLSWDAFAYSAQNQAVRAGNRILNSQLTKNTALFVGLAMSANVVAPVFVLAAFIMFKKMGLFRDNGNRRAMPDMYQRKALDAGLTVFSTERRGGQRQEVYMYKHQGRICTVPARDIRIPDHIKGVHLSADERERFRKGELLELKGHDGQTFHVRIDVTQPGLVREYFMQMKSDRQPTAKPTVRSSDTEKLQHIAKMGFQGVRDIYGKYNINLERDRFLEKNGMRADFFAALQAEERVNMAVGTDDKKAAEAEFKNFDRKLMDIADNVLTSQRKSGIGR